MKEVRHEIKYTRKTQMAWCTCRKWKMLVPIIPWKDKPPPELQLQVEKMLDEFRKHAELSKRV